MEDGTKYSYMVSRKGPTSSRPSPLSQPPTASRKSFPAGPESCSQSHLPPPVGAAELMACTMSVVRASSRLVINSIFFSSGQPER